VLGLLGIAGGLTRLDTFSGPLVAGLLVFPTLGIAAAPFNSLAAQRAALPPKLRERRRTEWSRERRGRWSAGWPSAAPRAYSSAWPCCWDCSWRRARIW
jgi:hypothetical protein